MDKIMHEYDIRHRKESKENYESDDEHELTHDNKELAKKIYSETDNHKYLQEVISKRDIDKFLLKYELKYLELEPEKMSQELFIKKTLSLIKRYQCKAGGYGIEDYEWEIYKDDFKNYRLKDNEIYLENTIDKFNAKDYDTTLFLKRITRLLNTLSTDVDVSYKLKEVKDDDITWIYIIVMFNSE